MRPREKYPERVERDLRDVDVGSDGAGSHDVISFVSLFGQDRNGQPGSSARPNFFGVVRAGCDGSRTRLTSGPIATSVTNSSPSSM